MFSWIRWSIYFTVIFLFLSISIGNKTIFHHISQVTNPVVKPVTSQINKIVTNAFHEGKGIVLQLFTNAEPIEDPKQFSDKVNSKLSASKKNKAKPIKNKSTGLDQAPSDDLTSRDKTQLKHFIKAQ
jgi:hypothetical protein